METVVGNSSFSESSKFSDLLSPIFVKELRQGLRANLFAWPFILVQIAAIACSAVEFFTAYYAGRGGGTNGVAFYVFMAVVFWGGLPLTLFGSLQPELANGRNVELLLMSNLTRWQIVLGKWGVGSVLSMLMLISLLPYFMFRYMIGNFSDFIEESLWLAGFICGNAVLNAIVIGASGFRNYVGRVIVILVSVACGFVTAMVVMIDVSNFGWWWYVASGLVVAPVLIVLNLQLGRALLRLYENPLDPPSSALIIVLIICFPIIVGVSRAMTHEVGGWGGILMSIILLVLCLKIDPGPGKKEREWAQA